MEPTMPDRTQMSRPSARARATIAAAIAVAAAAGCKKEDKNAFVAPPPPDVVVASPVARDVVRYITYTGTVEAAESVELRARVQGFLEKINYAPGQKVKKGDILFVIDKTQYQADLARAQAEVDSTTAMV